MLKISKRLFIAVISLSIVSCGGSGNGGGGGDGTSESSATFTSSAGVGEIVTFTVDTTALTYSYTVTESSYGLEGQTGSGTLTGNSDGSYTPSGFPGSRIQVYENGIMVGAVTFEINGQTINAPVVGLASPITSVASLAGTYNLLGETCEGPMAASDTGVGICNTVYGTLVIDSAGAYEVCTGSNLTTDPACGSGVLSSGTVVSAGDGLFEFNRTGTAFVAVDNANLLLASASPNGQYVVIIDTNDSASDGYGYGHLLGSTQTSTIDTVNAEGTWSWNANNGDSGTFDLSCSSSTVCTSTSGAVVTIGFPWAGLGTVTNGIYDYHVLLAGSGVYVQAAAPSQDAGDGRFNTYMEIGAHR